MILKYAAGRIMARLAPSRPIWLFRRGVIVRLARRELVWINVTAYPTAEWIARQITEAFPWNEVPHAI